jgi:hypothetical protein
MRDESGGDAGKRSSSLGKRMIAGMNDFLDGLKFGERIEDHFKVKDVFRCAMCGDLFAKTWSDNEALGEAIIKGIKSEDIADGCLVCDDCYRKTPWGGEPEEN